MSSSGVSLVSTSFGFRSFGLPVALHSSPTAVCRLACEVRMAFKTSSMFALLLCSDALYATSVYPRIAKTQNARILHHMWEPGLAVGTQTGKEKSDTGVAVNRT